MVNIVPGVDPENNKVILNVTTNLLGDYFNNFVGYLKKCSSMPSDLEVSKKDENTAIVQFSMPENSVIKKIDEQRSAVRVDLGDANTAINGFIKAALKYKLRRTEFIPLTGYPLEDLREDVKSAIKNKRNFCILETYQEYLENNKEFSFNQYYINYGTSEYSDVAISIMNGEMDELRDVLVPKLKQTTWV